MKAFVTGTYYAEKAFGTDLIIAVDLDGEEWVLTLPVGHTYGGPPGGTVYCSGDLLPVSEVRYETA